MQMLEAQKGRRNGLARGYGIDRCLVLSQRQKPIKQSSNWQGLEATLQIVRHISFQQSSEECLANLDTAVAC